MTPAAVWRRVLCGGTDVNFFLSFLSFFFGLALALLSSWHRHRDEGGGFGDGVRAETKFSLLVPSFHLSSSRT
ncbi:uncharacterized protein J3D65DRAFT_616149 [Phyllosticta citribraziliensis]|uniref:Uncharacterized protein n=1 Tax=Phyllosticta citribraziliensis TaxID=989973 RepID=A0ABR1LZR4_9PEZI